VAGCPAMRTQSLLLSFAGKLGDCPVAIKRDRRHLVKMFTHDRYVMTHGELN